jgi:hypothetical protein
MRVATLLIIWSIPLLAGWHGPDRCRADRPGLPHLGAAADVHVPQTVMRRTRDASFAEDPSSGRCVLPPEDEEDGLEDGSSLDGLLLGPSWRDLGRGALAGLAHVPGEFSRIAAHPHPLRC